MRRDAWRGGASIASAGEGTGARRSALILSTTPPLARDYGNWSRVHQTFSFFREHGFEISLLLYPLGEDWCSQIPDYYQDLKGAVDYLSIVQNSRPLHEPPKGRHYLIDEWWDDAIGEQLSWLLARRHFDVLLVNYVFLSKAFELAPPSTAKVLDTHDIMTGRRELFERHGATPEFFYTEADQERIGLDRADVVIAIKQSDRELLQQRTHAPVMTIPYRGAAAVGARNPRAPANFTGLRPLRAGFIGADNGVNAANLRSFIPVLAERIERDRLPIVFKVAGNVCRRLGAAPPFVQFLGHVESLSEFYDGIDVVVVPFEFSTGIKIKVAEALAWARPVLATRDAFDGFRAFHASQQLPSRQDVCDTLADIAHGKLPLAELQAAAQLSARAAAQDAAAGFAQLHRRILARMPRIVVASDTPFWQRKSLFDEWVAQSVERLGQVAPVVVANIGTEHAASAAPPRGLDLLRMAPEGPDFRSLFSGQRTVGTFLALVDPELRDAAVRASAAAGAPCFDFVARGDGPGGLPEIGVSPADAPDRVWPLAPLRHVPGHRNWGWAPLDRSRLLAITSEPAAEWNAAALKALSRLAADRGIAVSQLDCCAGAERSEAFTRALIDRLPQPAVYVGRPSTAWAFCRQLLDLAGIPYLQLAPGCILPLVRSKAGLPSLLASIAGFLDGGQAPRPAPPAEDAGWQRLNDALGSCKRHRRRRPVAETDRWFARWRSLRATVGRAIEDTGTSARIRAQQLGRVSEAVLECYREWAARGEGSVAYRLCFRAVGQLCGEPLFQQLWRGESALFRRVFGELSLAETTHSHLVRAALQRVVWQHAWEGGLKKLQREDFGRLLRVLGTEHLDPDWRRTGAIFVHWHTPFAEAFWTWLAHEGIEPGTIIGRGGWDERGRDRNAAATAVLDSARDLWLARDALAQGRHVHVLADGYVGRRGIGLPFLGRVRPFQQTFAQLALRTGAPVHPVSVDLGRGGNPVVRFGPAFPSAATTSGGSGAAVRTLVESYAHHLSEEWMARPAEIGLPQMVRFMLLERSRAPAEIVPPARPDPRIAICLGMYGSGSTWAFNVIREIWNAEARGCPGALRSLYLDGEADLPPDIFEARYIALKTHMPRNTPSDGLYRLLAICRGPVVVTIRDPRDAVASLMQRFHITFDEALRRVASSAAAIVQLEATRKVLLLRYEDHFIGTVEAFDAIASALTATPGADQRGAILTGLGTDAVQSMIATLSASGVITSARPWDPETHWHSGHLGDGRVGKYRDLLSDAQQSLVAWRTSAFSTRFGYASSEEKAPSRCAVLTDIAFWEADSLFAEWMRQWIERLGEVLPIIVLYHGARGAARGPRQSAFDVVPIADAASEIGRVLAEYRILGVVFGFADAAKQRRCRTECEAAIQDARVPFLQFAGGADVAPHLRSVRAGAGCTTFPIAPLRQLPGECRWIGSTLDRSRLLVITAEPADEWNVLALACLSRLAERRGIGIRQIVCGAGAQHSPEFFRQALGGPAQPCVFIGAPCAAWAFCRHALDLAGIPHLSLAADCIVPLARSEAGAPSLVQSITRFLDDAPPSATPVPDAGWDGICSALVPA